MNQSEPMLSVVMIARNEGWRLADALKPIARDFADEIVLGDTGSTDDTEQIAHEFGARVVQIPFRGFGVTKQLALNEARGRWVLALDADEIVGPMLRAEILQTIEKPDAKDGYYLPRQAWFLGRCIHHGGWGTDSVLRLFRRGRGQYDDAIVHEEIRVDGLTGHLGSSLEHHTDPTLPRYMAKIDRYSSLAARRLAADSSKHTGAWPALTHALARLWKQLVLRRGWRDGLPGVILAVSSAYASFLRYTKAELIRRGDGKRCGLEDLGDPDSE